MKSKKTKLPIIEQILLIGLEHLDLKDLLSKSQAHLFKIKPSITGSVLNRYSSIYLKEQVDHSFLAKIPYGIYDICFNSPKKKSFISFSLLFNQSHKHCTCLSINSSVQPTSSSSSAFILSISTGIVLISSKEIYTTHKEILDRLYEILIVSNSTSMGLPALTSGGRSNSLSAVNTLLCSGQLSTININASTTLTNDYSSIEFFFGFILNSLYYTKNSYGNFSTSLCVNVIDNNSISNKHTNFLLFKLYLDDNGNETVIPLKEYDMSILLEKFYAEDLIKIYQSILMEYRIIIVYDSSISTYNEINTIVNSLIALVFPLPIKHYQLFPYLNLLNIKDDVVNLPTVIFGIEQSHYDSICHNFYTEKTIIFSLCNKKILYFPETFPSFPPKTMNEIASNLYQTLAEKLAINSDLSFEDTDLGKMFEEKTCVKMNSVLYFNMKIISIFYLMLLKIIRPFNMCCNFNKDKEKDKESIQLSSISAMTTRSANVKGITTAMISNEPRHRTASLIANTELFNYDKFQKETFIDHTYQRFIVEFSNSKMFNIFIKKYIHNHNRKGKYKFIHEMIDVINPNKNFNQSFKKTFLICIKKKISDYYNFIYINYAKAYDVYVNHIEKIRDINTIGHQFNSDICSTSYYNYNPMITSLYKANPQCVKACCEDYEKYLIENKEIVKKFELWKIYNAIKDMKNLLINNAYGESGDRSNGSSNNIIINNRNNNNTSGKSIHTNRLNVSEIIEEKEEGGGIPAPVSTFDLGNNDKNTVILKTSQFYNKQAKIIAPNANVALNIDDFSSMNNFFNEKDKEKNRAKYNAKDKEILLESKNISTSLRSNSNCKTVYIGATTQSKSINPTICNSKANGNNNNTDTNNNINTIIAKASKKVRRIMYDKSKNNNSTNNNNETIGQQIKAKLHSNYLCNIINSSSNKNLASLIKNMTLVSPKQNNNSNQTRTEMPIKQQLEINTLRNAHSAIKRNLNMTSIKDKNIDKIKHIKLNNNLQKLEGDNDCDILSEND